jgi:MFS transporter, DHA1 family, inner membrane transport protein
MSVGESGVGELHVITGPEAVAAEFVTHPGEAGVDQPPAAIGAAMVLGTVAYMILGIQPILLGALVEAGRLTNHALGKVATLETLALAIGAAVGPPFLRRGGIQAKIALAALALAALDVADYWAASPMPIYLLRTAAGAIEGLLLAGAILVVTYTRNPERMNGLFLAITTAPQIAATYLLSAVAIPRFGANAGFGLMAALSGLGAFSALALSDRTTSSAHALGAAKGVWTPWVLLMLVAILLQNAAIGAAWNYVEQIAHQWDISNQIVGLAVSGGLTFQLVGALGVAWIGWRFDHKLMLAAGCAVQALDVIVLGSLHAPMVYLGASCVFGLLWLALLPFEMKLLIELDRTRQVAMILSPVSLIGLSIGPFVGSLLVRENDVSPAFWFAAAATAASGALYTFTALAARRPAPA